MRDGDRVTLRNEFDDRRQTSAAGPRPELWGSLEDLVLDGTLTGEWATGQRLPAFQSRVKNTPFHSTKSLFRGRYRAKDVAVEGGGGGGGRHWGQCCIDAVSITVHGVL